MKPLLFLHVVPGERKRFAKQCAAEEVWGVTWPSVQTEEEEEEGSDRRSFRGMCLEEPLVVGRF